jgi:MFS family permease
VVYSFKTLFWVDATTSVLAAALLFYFFRRALPAREGSKDKAAASTGPLKDPRFVFILVPFIVIMTVFIQNSSTMSLFVVQDLGLSAAFFGLSITINTIMIVTMEIPISHMTSRFSHRLTMTLGAMFFAVGFGILALVHGRVGVMLSVVIWTLGEIVLFPALITYIVDIAPSSRRGQYMGLYTMSMGVAFIVGPWAGAQVFEHHGARVLWLGTFIVGLISASLFSQVER